MAVTPSIDLNADVGEDRATDIDEALMRLVTSVSIACGGHAGDERTMRERLLMAAELGIRVGAHPSYPDRSNFGRLSVDMPVESLMRTIVEQVEKLQEIAAGAGAHVAYLKPHGALYNDAAKRPEVAEAVFAAAKRTALPVMMLASFAAGRPGVLAEGFIDRSYLPDGSLRPRSEPDALILDPQQAATQALELALRVDSLCVHSDTPGAVELMQHARRRLEASGFRVGP